jgi:hypothetical protein
MEAYVVMVVPTPYTKFQLVVEEETSHLAVESVG